MTHADSQATHLRICIGLIAGHLLVDAFVDLRPGTSGSDHLASGVIPIVLLSVLAAGIGRTRDGVAATIAGLVGLATVIGGAIPLAVLVQRERITVGTLTGVIGAMAGATLLWLGASMLFQARDCTGGRLRRWSRRTGRGTLGVLLALMTAWPVGGAFITANRSDGYHLDVALADPADDPVTLQTEDGLRLAAAYRPSTNRAAIIVFPGRQPAHEALLAAHGYGVLILAPRGRGDSEGDPHLLGWTGARDIQAAVRYLQSRPDVDDDRIGGLGLSVGGELMLEAASRNPSLRAVVAEGAGTRWVGEDLHTPAPLLAVPISAMETLATAVFSDSLPPRRLEDVVSEIAPRPIMLIWTRNGMGGEDNNPRYFDNAHEPKTIWEIVEGGHAGGIDARPDEYEQRVVAFFNRAFRSVRRPGQRRVYRR